MNTQTEVGDKIGRRLDPQSVLADFGGLASDPTAFIEKKDGRISIGQAIRRIRKEKGVSQEILAKKALIDRTTIARVECGIFKSLSMEKLGQIAQALDMDLKTLLFKAESMGEALNYHGDLSRAEFTLEFPEEGFRLLSITPKRKEFFFGKIEIKPHRTIPSSKLPHPEQIYLHTSEGKMLLIREGKEFLLKTGDCFAFAGFRDYELYNPDQLKDVSSLFITCPSFLAVS